MNKFNIGDKVYSIAFDVLSSFTIDTIELNHGSGEVLYSGEDTPHTRIEEDMLYDTEDAAIFEMLKCKRQRRAVLASQLASLDESINVLESRLK